MLKIADQGLQQVERALAQAAIAATCRPEHVVERIAKAQEAVRDTRRLLIVYYDNDEYSEREDLAQIICQR